jgi:hypothetical protein
MSSGPASFSFVMNGDPETYVGRGLAPKIENEGVT